MEGTASTSNEGSKKRNLEQYKEVKTKTVSSKDLQRELKMKDFADLDKLNAMAFHVDNRERNNESNSSSVSSSSADSFVIDLEEILESGVVVGKIRSITPENKVKIDRRRAKEKQKREAEKDAREAEEAKEAEDAKKIKQQEEIEENNNIK